MLLQSQTHRCRKTLPNYRGRASGHTLHATEIEILGVWSQSHRMDRSPYFGLLKSKPKYGASLEPTQFKTQNTTYSCKSTISKLDIYLVRTNWQTISLVCNVFIMLTFCIACMGYKTHYILLFFSCVQAAGDLLAKQRQETRQPTRHSNATWRITTECELAGNVASDEFARHFDSQSQLLIYVSFKFIFVSFISCVVLSVC